MSRISSNYNRDSIIYVNRDVNNIYVNNKFIIKSINDDKDDGLKLISTSIQQCIVPKIYENENNINELQFKYRINESASTGNYIVERNKFKKDIVRDNQGFYNYSITSTYSMELPLQYNIIFNHFPFRLYKAYVKIELSSLMLNENNILRPNFCYECEYEEKDSSKENHQKLIRIKNTDKYAVSLNPNYDKLFNQMDKTRKFDILSPIPFVYGEKDIINANNSIIIIGYYLYEPILRSFFNMIAPLIMILFLMTSAVMIEMSESSFLGIMCGIILAVVFVVNNIRRPIMRSKFSSTDLYIVLLLSGLSICALSFLHPLLKYIGLCVSWSSNIIPVIGIFRYYMLKSKILKESSKYKDMIQNPESNINPSESIIDINKIKLIPDKYKSWGYIK